jgi:hypothetical protein
MNSEKRMLEWVVLSIVVRRTHASILMPSRDEDSELINLPVVPGAPPVVVLARLHMLVLVAPK